MESSVMKNIVVLKNLPSNLVKEAFVILKENDRIHIEDFINRDNIKNNEKNLSEKKEDNRAYIVKEAEMLVSSYISDIERRKNEDKKNIWKVKYEKSKLLNVFLIIASTILFIRSVI